MQMSAVSDVQFTPPQSGLTVEPSEQQPAEIIDPVVAATLEIYGTRGWTRTDKTGRNVPDDAKARTFVYELFRGSVVNNESDIADDGLSQWDVYAKTFPNAIGSSVTVEIDDERYQAYVSVMRKLWQYASPKVGGYCQDAAEMDGLDYVMVEKKVFRASKDASTGTGAMQSLVVRFFTQDADLIFELSSQPAAAKLVKAAEETAKHLQMNTKRHPELANRVAKETRSAIKRSEAHLAPVTASKTAALTSGNGDDN